MRASYLSLTGRDADPYAAMFAPDADIAASRRVVERPIIVGTAARYT